MTSEMQKILNQVWKNNAEKQMSLSNVIKTTCDALRADRLGAGVIYAELIGDGGKNKSVRQHFIDKVISELNYVVYNGTNKKVAIDFVKVDKEDLAKQNRAIREYHIVDEQPVVLDTCVWHIERTVDVVKTINYTHESGYVEPIPMRDAEGKKITEKQVKCFVPREKTMWGYTDEVKKAFFAALDAVEQENN